ncbi:MAG: MBL fold metallo-hydrolase [Verrucomicrobiales bacterium]|jgi:glyoxylase-like metal-dependent hydrolase (beta-lactamase superfamily II)|nr:MBL fold metallo-hydrolase [Verrucomicrobiales bacterium]
MKFPSHDKSVSSGISRRKAIQMFGLGMIASTAFGGRLNAAGSASTTKRPPAREGNAETWRFMIGNIEAISVCDGFGTFSPAHTVWPKDATESGIARQLEAAFLPAGKAIMSYNVLVLRTGKEVILVDTGCGAVADTDSGRLIANLATVNLRPQDITAVVITHGHSDHIGGLLDAAGAPTFTNARLFIRKKELDYWFSENPDTSTMIVDETAQKWTVGSARKYLGPLKDAFLLVEPGQRILDCIEIVDTAGHTPGHASLLIRSGEETLFHMADVTHHSILSFANPEWRLSFDSIPELAATTRRKILTWLSSERTRALSYHAPFPGVAHIAADGRGFRWVPEHWSIV